MQARILLAGLVLLILGACAGPSVDLAAWRARESVSRPAEQRREPELDAAEIERLRAADDLGAARALALSLAAERPDEPAVLALASRAESDAVFTFAEDDKDSRNHAAASSLDYAERAAKLGAASSGDRAQLAWALGTTTHLQPMFGRSEHAARTIEAAQAALELDEDEPTALATLAVVNLRLETLPWIASVMAMSRPSSSLQDAEALARRAVAARPSRENRLILAKVLTAAERESEACAVLEEALAETRHFPRDRALEAPIRELLSSLRVGE